MLTADGLAVAGRAVAVCVLVTLLAGAGRDAVLAAASAAVVAFGAVAGRGRLAAALSRTGPWRASVAADGLAATGAFAVMLHQDARADHPLVLVFGIAAAGLGIAAQSAIGARTPLELVRPARDVLEPLAASWRRRRRRLGALSLAAGAAGVVVLGPGLGWVAFACFAQAAEAVVVLVPFFRASDPEAHPDGHHHPPD